MCLCVVFSRRFWISYMLIFFVCLFICVAFLHELAKTTTINYCKDSQISASLTISFYLIHRKNSNESPLPVGYSIAAQINHITFSERNCIRKIVDENQEPFFLNEINSIQLSHFNQNKSK